MNGGDGDDVMIGGGSIDAMSGEGGYDRCSVETHECEDKVSGRADIVALYDAVEQDHEDSNAAIFAAGASWL